LKTLQNYSCPRYRSLLNFRLHHTYFGNKLARWIAGEDMPSPPASVYAAPFSEGEEVTAIVRPGGRVEVLWNAPDNGDEDSMSAGLVNFGVSQDVTPVDEVRVYDAATEGNPLLVKLLPAPSQIELGTIVRFEPGSMIFEP
jgi:hypothetical protein